MFSSVQVVLLFDVNSLGEDCQTESELERNVAKLKLGSLKLLTEFGAKTEKGLEVVRWSSRFYDSFSYKPNTSRKSFVDLNRASFEEFENGIADGFCNAFDRRQSDNHPRKNSHSFVLRKCLQEILLDYNWDGPDISSPVKKSGPARRRSSRGAGNKVLPENQGPYNTVIVFTNVPQSVEGVSDFCRVGSPRKGAARRSSSNVTGEDYLGELLDPATYKGFQEDKRIHLNFVAVNSLQSLRNESGTKIYSVINAGLGKLGGGLHLIGKIVETLSSQHVQDECQDPQEELFPSPNLCSESIRIPTPWWKKSKANRPRRPQRGPTLVWEDAEGISNIQVQLEVLAVHGSSSRNWGIASVVAVMQSSALSLLAMAGGTGHLYVCHAPNTVFTSLIQLLNMQQLSMLLKLSCGGVAVLSPWAGGVGSLAVVSASGLGMAPLFAKSSPQESKKIHPNIQKFVTQSSRKCLKNAPAHTGGEPRGTTKRFAAHKTERWFKPLLTCDSAVKRIVKKRANKAERLVMQERLQKKYRPQIPRLLTTGEIEKVDLVDITQPPPEPEPGASTKPNMSRAQQLVKKSHIVTAQQKVKEQLAEEEERVQATERRAALASEQARKSQALESHVLNTVSDPQNTEELRQSLIQLRESSGKETDTYTTAQTIINLVLMHIKSNSNVHIEDELGRVLGDGVLQSAADINSMYPAESRLSQYQLQILLHLELLWLFGYSSSGVTDEEEQDSRGGNLREHHIGEAVKLLRAISLTHNPATMARFLQETILDNYGETLGEVLVELYEELNQPLPEALRVISGELSSVYPSVRSLGSMMGPESNCSVENPDSGKSREERRMLRHPSLMEAGKNRIVVPMATRALKRTNSEHTKVTSTLSSKGPTLSNKEAPENEVQKVRRNLFDLSEGPSKVKLKRSHTIDVPLTERRRSPRKKNKVFGNKSPLRNSDYQKTPVKGTTASSRGLRTPKLRRSGVLAPETPGNKIGQTIFNKKRIRKSTGTTLITESPEVKRACRTTPRRLRASLTVSRRNSFYSGARSRNWERAKTQLLADRIRGKSGQRRIDQKSLQNLDASFLFTEIISDEHTVVSQCDNQENNNEYIETPKRKILDFEHNDAESEHNDVESDRTLLRGNPISRSSVKEDFKNKDSPAKYTRLSDKMGLQKSLSFGADSRTTPVKNVRRALSLSTPSKVLPFQNSTNDYSCSSKVIISPEKPSTLTGGALCPVTPKRMCRTNLDVGLYDVTPSKRVQFNFTPSKEFPASSNMRTPCGKNRSLSSDTPVTPKSILKTPKKTPNKTPIKARSFLSPDIFASSRKIRVSPATTPLKTRRSTDTVKLSDHSLSSEMSPGSQFSGFSDQAKVTVSPVEVSNIGCFEGSEIELVSPMKESRGSSKASLILHNTPKKGHPVGDSFDSKPCKLSFDDGSEDEYDDMDGVSDNSVNLDVDVDTKMSDLSHMKPEDIEMISNLLFENFDSNSGLDIGGLDDVNEIETVEAECENLGSLSSPLKYGSKSYVDAISGGDTQLVSLPDKQELQEEMEHFSAGNHNDSTLLSESVEYSPLDDKNTLPTMDNILNQYLVNENELQSDTEKLSLNSSEMIEQMAANDSGCSFYETDSTSSVSPEIPLDYQAIYSLQRNRAPEGKDKSLDALEGKGESLDALEGKGESLDALEGKGESLDALKGEGENLDALEGKGESLDSLLGKGESLNALEGKCESLNALEGKGENLDALEGKGESLDALEGKGESLDALGGKDESLDALEGKSESPDTLQGKGENLDALEGKSESLDALEGKGESLDALGGKGESLDALEGKSESLNSSVKKSESPDALQGKDKSLDVPEVKGEILDAPNDGKSELSSESDTIFGKVKVEKTSPTRESSTGKRMLSSDNNQENVKQVFPSTRVVNMVSGKRKFSLDSDQGGKVSSKRRVSSGVSRKRKLPRDDDLEKNEEKVNFVQPKRRLSKRKSSDVVEDFHTSDLSEDSPDSAWSNEDTWPQRGRRKSQVTENMESRLKRQKTYKKVRRQKTHISSTPANNGIGLKRNSSDSSEKDQQENNIVSRRRLSRRVTRVRKERRTSRRMCRTKMHSLKEVSSDDESFGICGELTHSFGQMKRIFDDDSDFISPEKSVKIGGLKELPLKNVANLPAKKMGKVNSTCTDDSELHGTVTEEDFLSGKTCSTLPDNSELHCSGSNLDQSSSGLVRTPVKKGKQQKIDIYLSPVNDKRSDCKNQAPHHRAVQTVNRNRPQTPNDWKRIKPRRAFKREANGKGDVSQISQMDSSKCVQSNQSSRSNGLAKGRKRKKKGVKLKLTKSGDNYEVSKVDLSLDSSDRNSSAADPQNLTESIAAKDVMKESSPSTKKRKKSSDHKCIITPLRFTRHMSKDLSVTPELFSQLIALSPKKEDPKKSDSEAPKREYGCDIRKRKRDLLKHFNGKVSRNQESVEDCGVDSIVPLANEDPLSSEWTVQNLPGSPTMKTFIRKQKRKHYIKSSPRVELSPLPDDAFEDQTLIKPSLMSIAHLSVSPIMNTVNEKAQKRKKRSSRKLYSNRGGITD